MLKVSPFSLNVCNLMYTCMYVQIDISCDFLLHSLAEFYENQIQKNCRKCTHWNSFERCVITFWQRKTRCQRFIKYSLVLKGISGWSDAFLSKMARTRYMHSGDKNTGSIICVHAFVCLLYSFWLLGISLWDLWNEYVMVG